MMNTKELIEKLSQYPPHTLVVLASDEEGNSFNVLSDIEGGYNYDAEERGIGLSELTDELMEYGYSEDDVKDGLPCVVIWP